MNLLLFDSLRLECTSNHGCVWVWVCVCMCVCVCVYFWACLCGHTIISPSIFSFQVFLMHHPSAVAKIIFPKILLCLKCPSKADRREHTVSRTVYFSYWIRCGDTLYGSVSEIESCSSRISRHYGGKSALGKTKKLHSRKDKKALLLNLEFLRRIPRTMILKKTFNHLRLIRRTAPFISGRSEKERWRGAGGR